jgi:hypothetical protein
MVKKLFLFFYIWSGFATGLSAQNNTISLGALYLPVNGAQTHIVSAGYFHPLYSGKSLGLKMTWGRRYESNEYSENTQQFFGMDLLKRWGIPAKKGNSILWLDAGVSLALQTDNVLLKNHDPVGWCGVGLEYLEHFDNPAAQQNWAYGLASAASWEWAIGKHWGLGAGAQLNIYYQPGDGWCLLPLPQIKSSFSF